MNIFNVSKSKLINKGAVAQLGERLDGIQKVVGSIPSSSTIINLLSFSLLFFFNNLCAETIEPHKLLIPGESFRSEAQKNFEIENFKKSKISYFEFRKKKCYKKSFVIFPRSKLCTHDPHMCAQDFAVEEIHYFLKYKRYLLDISEVCAQGFPIDYSDSNVVKGNSTKDVEEFLKYLKKKKKVNYDNPFEAQEGVNKKTNLKIRENNGAHGAINNVIDENKIKNHNSSASEIKEKEAQLIKMEQKLIVEKELLEEEEKLLEKKKKLKELEIKIFESEEILKKKRNDFN